MLRKDVIKLSEPETSGSDSVLTLSEVRVTSDTFMSDLFPIFEDTPRSSDNDETVTMQQECCDGY